MNTVMFKLAIAVYVVLALVAIGGVSSGRLSLMTGEAMLVGGTILICWAEPAKA